MVLGVFGAVYFQQNQPSAPKVASNAPSPPPAPASATPDTAAQPPAPTQAQENTQASQAVPSRESQPAPTPPQTAAAPAAPPASPAPVVGLPASPPEQAPAAATSPEPPPSVAQDLARISPSAAPADIAAAAPRYWVEFGAYHGAFYADRLKQRLGKLGIAATVSEAPGRHGRRYLRVRGADQSDRATAVAQFDEVHRALRIAPLLHRVATVNPGVARAAHTPPRGAHWVQFGAFRSRQRAESQVTQLRKEDVHASVLEVKSSGKEHLYLVRSGGLPDRAAAAKVAQQGAAALHSKDVLIGESLRVAGLNARPPPR